MTKSTRFTDTYCVVCNIWETSWKKRNVHKPQQRLWLHDQPTMLAGEVSDEIEEARRPNEQRQSHSLTMSDELHLPCIKTS